MPILLTCAGCIQKTANGDVSTYGFESWMVLCVAVGGALAVPLGWRMRKQNARFGYSLLILGPLAAIFVAPAIWTDRVVVDSNHFERSSAMPGSINSSIPFDDVLALHYHSAVENKGRRTSRKYQLDVTRKGGQVQTIAVGTLLQQAIEEIFDRAAAKGIKLSEDHQ